MSLKSREYNYSASNKREKRSLHFHPHHLPTSVNITNNLDEIIPIQELFDESQWQSDYPIPINSPTTLADRDKRLDNRNALVHEKEKHQKLLKQIQQKYQENIKKKIKKKVSNKTVKSTEFGYISQYAEVFASDPDPYFSGAYNWYFTGTNMIIDETNDGDQWLYYVAGSGLDKLKLSKIAYDCKTGIKLNKETVNILPNKLLNRIESGGMIYELNQQNKQISIRQKHKLTTIYQNKIINQYETPDKVPLVSACTVNGSNQQLITIDANRMIRINNLNRSNTTTESTKYNLLTDKELNSDNWSCLRPFNLGHNTFTYANRRNIRIFDSRKEISIVKPTLAFEFGNLIDCCEEIISIEPSSKNLNVLYISTTHKLFSVDIRQLNLSNTRLLKWNHQLKCHPTTICIFNKLNMTNNNNKGEIIVIGGSLAGDYRLCETKLMQPSSLNDSNYYSTYLPQKPINIFESYDQTKMRGYCLEPLTRVAQQIKLSITGMAICQPMQTPSNQNNFYLLQQNCLGDIFAQNFTNKSMEKIQTKTIVCDSFIEWDNKLKTLIENKNESFCATDLTTFNSMAACLAKNIINPNGVGGFDDIIGDNHQQSIINITKQEEEEEIHQLKRPKRWQQSYQRLQSYTDAIANDMLSIWDIHEDKLPDLPNYTIDGNNTTEHNNITQEMNDTTKVMNWLNVTKSEISFSGTNLPQSTQKNADSYELQSSEPWLVSTAAAELLDTTDVMATSPRKKKKLRQSRVFVPGF